MNVDATCVSVEMIYHLRCAKCASAYRNLGRAIWRLPQHIEVDVGLLPAITPAESMPERDFELHCLIQRMQCTAGGHGPRQILMDAMADGAAAISSREDIWDLAARAGIEPATLAESATAVRNGLARLAALDTIRAPAFLIDDEHLLHGDASPAFLHDVLHTLAGPRQTTPWRRWTGLRKWTS